MCPGCAAFNFAKRTELADLRGRVALLTGGRVKIGYQAGLKLLRAGAHLIVTTRFPRDSAARYAGEPDFDEWGHRLEIFGLDLRHTPSVEAFCRELLATRDRLDFIINNACQTVRRPPEFYEHMMAQETAALHAHARARRAGSWAPMRAGAALILHFDGAPAATPAAFERRLPSIAGLANSAELSQVPLLPEEHGSQRHLFPEGRLDQDLQQVDLRERNSWRMLMADVPSVELLEVQLVNAIAPFILNARLKPLMLRTPERDKHIVNVSAVEGQFYRNFKTTRHPHTNMAKAALNMMTRTSAADYHSDGIHMNSVDTGWVTDEDPAEHRGAEGGRASLPSAAGHRGWRRAHRGPDHRRHQHRATTCGASSSRTTSPPIGKGGRAAVPRRQTQRGPGLPDPRRPRLLSPRLLHRVHHVEDRQVHRDHHAADDDAEDHDHDRLHQARAARTPRRPLLRRRSRRSWSASRPGRRSARRPRSSR